MPGGHQIRPRKRFRNLERFLTTFESLLSSKNDDSEFHFGTIRWTFSESPFGLILELKWNQIGQRDSYTHLKFRPMYDNAFQGNGRFI